jgi:hypothetical protein
VRTDRAKVDERQTLLDLRRADPDLVTARAGRTMLVIERHG